MSKNFWKNKRILITGHTGFKGSWLALLLNQLGANVYGLSDEKKEGIYEIVEKSQFLIKEYFENINNIDDENAKKILGEIEPDIVFHFAAQSLVYKGYLYPKDTINTNILGTYNILDYVDKLTSAKTITVATTDKVYIKPQINNVETDELGGKDFYSASKAGAEFIIQAFLNNKERADLNVTVIRSGNVIGGGDRGEYRLMTDLINSIYSNKDFELRKPESIRPWQFVLDSLWGYLLATEDSYSNNRSEIFNLNSAVNNKYTAKRLVDLYLEYWGSGSPRVEVTKQMFQETDILTINSSKAENELGWVPIYNVEETIKQIVVWEKRFKEDKEPLTSNNQISEYISLRN